MARVYCFLNQVLRGKDALESPPATLKRDGPGVIARDPHSLGTHWPNCLLPSSVWTNNTGSIPMRLALKPFWKWRSG